MLRSARKKVVDLLIWSEYYFKTDMRYLAKGGFLISTSQAITILGAFVMSILFAHLAEKETYGLYKYILGIAAIFSNLSLMGGIKLTVLQLSASGTRGIMRAGFMLGLMTSVLTFVGSVVGATYYAAQGNLDLAIGILIAGSLQPFVSSYGLYAAYLNGKKDFLRTAYLSLLKTAISVVIIGAALVFHSHVLTLVFAFIAANLLGSAVAYYMTASWYPGSMADSAYDRRDLLKLSSHVSFIGIVKGVADNLDTVVIFHFLGAAPLAVYAFAVAVPQQIMGIMGNAIYTLAVPRFAASFSSRNPHAHADPGQERARAHRSITRKALIAFLVAVPIAIAYMIAAPYVYGFLLPQYMTAVPYSQFFALMILISNMTSVFGSFQDSQRNIRDKYLASFPAVALRVVLMVVLVQIWGLWGIVASEFLARCLNALLSYILLRHYSR